jgi:hypothetical protein
MTWRARWDRPDETAYMKVSAITAGVVVGVSLLAMIMGISSKGYSILMRTASPLPQEPASNARQTPTSLPQAPPDTPEPSAPKSVPAQSPNQAAEVKQLSGSTRQPTNPGALQRVQSPDTIAPPVASGKTRIAIKANQGSWIDACSDGRTIIRKYLPPLNRVDLEFSSDSVIRLGNSGGVEISVNGAPTGPLGVLGQMRVVQFDSKGSHFLMPGDPGAECGK